MLGGLLWGAFLMLFGFSIILEVIFGIKIPITRTFIGIFLLYLGFNLITGFDQLQKAKNKMTFMEATTTHVDKLKIDSSKKRDEYTTLFGSAQLDLSHISLTEKPAVITINTVFGNSDIKINPAIPTKIMVNSAFAKAELPDETNVIFGRHTYRTSQKEQPELIIKANVVFGKLTFYTD